MATQPKGDTGCCAIHHELCWCVWVCACVNVHVHTVCVWGVGRDSERAKEREREREREGGGEVRGRCTLVYGIHVHTMSLPAQSECCACVTSMA